MIRIKMSETAKRLEPKLRELYNTDDFVQGIVLIAGTDENLEKISDYIELAKEAGDDITSDEVTNFALFLDGKLKINK